MITTLNRIRAHDPCVEGWVKLLRSFKKPQPVDAPLSIARVLDSNGLNDAIWCLRAVEGYDREIRLYAVWCARRVQHLTTDPRSIVALDVAEKYARGEATYEELRAARAASIAAAGAARGAAVAAWSAAWSAAGAAAWLAAAMASRDAERKAQAAELRRICEEAKP